MQLSQSLNKYQPEHMKPPAARIPAASKTCPALLSKSAQTHLRGKSPGAAADRLIETPVAKSLIFQSYSLNISLWGAELSYCVELLSHRGQTTKQLSAVVKRLGNQQKTPPTPPLPCNPPWCSDCVWRNHACHK